jgi:hypothetical protein
VNRKARANQRLVSIQFIDKMAVMALSSKVKRMMNIAKRVLLVDDFEDMR